jgi:raffinose/stachyose/melibiose transport system substrate-binding protein
VPLFVTLTLLLATYGDATNTSAPAVNTTLVGAATTNAASGGTPITLTYLIDDSKNPKDSANAFIDTYKTLHPNVTINVEMGPVCTDGHNLFKKRLASGDITDIFEYNSDSLLQALKPTQTLVDHKKLVEPRLPGRCSKLTKF